MSSLSIQSNKKPGKNVSSRIRYASEIGRRMEERSAEGADVIDRWLLKMHSNFERYEQELPRDHVIRCEDICSSHGRVLEVIVPAARELDEPLENKNLNPLYKRDKVLRYGERLLEGEGAYWNFYPRESVEEIMNGLA